MNGKANVSKELSAKQRKVLEGLLKLPENRECADCKCKAPRWASVNLGIFVCMQCSGIHRSLGVHISKVRSATLDTWLPEQVLFIQSMGNEKANSYWEAELPPNYDRVGIENFIRAKYEEKRWVPKDGKTKLPERREVQDSGQWQRPNGRIGHGHSNSRNSFDEKKPVTVPNRREYSHPVRTSTPVPPKGPEQPAPIPVPDLLIQDPEPAAPTESSKQPVSPPKVDYATDLFGLLSMDGPAEKSTGASGNDDTWAGFQSIDAVPSTTEKTAPIKVEDKKTQSASGVEELFKDLPSLTPSSMSGEPQKDVKNDIMSLFEKSNVVSPFSLHQQQLAMLAQQQSILMTAAANSSVGMSKAPGNTQLGQNGTTLPNQSWPNVGYQFPGMMTTAAGNGRLDTSRYMQMGIMGATHPVGNSFPHSMSSTYAVGLNSSNNGSVPSRAGKQPVSSVSPSPLQSGKEFDFSSLTQGFFSKN